MVKTLIARKLYITGFVAAAISLGSASMGVAQTADAKAEKYASVLQQIADVKLSIAQKEAYLASQEAQIASLRAQIKSVDATKETVAPMLAEMVKAIEVEIASDLPFKRGERYARLDDLRETIADAAASPGEKMRKALTLYDIEVGYGNSVSAYAGNHPQPESAGSRFKACEANQESSDCGLTDEMRKDLAAGATISDLKSRLADGAYLHYGRLSFTYVHHDSSEAWRYDRAAGERGEGGWVNLKGSDIQNARRSVRIARGESAPGVVTAPIVAQ